MNILSIQSAVAYGHVGNSAAVFPLQRMGFEVWPVNTVHFSNHTGYGQCRGSGLPAAEVAGIEDWGIEDRGALAGLDIVLSDYMGVARRGHCRGRWPGGGAQPEGRILLRPRDGRDRSRPRPSTPC